MHRWKVTVNVKKTKTKDTKEIVIVKQKKMV